MPDDLLTDAVDPKTLPSGWSKIPAPVEWQDLGTEWVKSSRGVALIVPSAIIPNERNVLLNHGYPDMVRVVRQPLQSFTFDPRMRQ